MVKRTSGSLELVIAFFSLIILSVPSSADAQLLCRWYGINCPPPPPTTPVVESLTISPDGDLSFATFDLQQFTVTANWSDGVADPDLTRAGAAPVWTASYGSFEAPYEGRDRDGPEQGFQPGWLRKMAGDVPLPEERLSSWTGNEALWSNGWNENGQGTVRVSYGGITEEVVVEAKDIRDTNIVEHIIVDGIQIPLTAGLRFGAWTNQVPEEECLFDRFGIDELNIVAATAWAVRGPLLAELRRQRIVRRSWDSSDKLTQFIRDWAKGSQEPTPLPDGLIDDGLQNDKAGWVIKKPEDVDWRDQWTFRAWQHSFNDHSRVYNYAWDPHVSYALMPYLAPYGATLTIDGEFPHARQYTFNATPPFNGDDIWSWMGATEVPVTDVDIEPKPGHTNPYRVGADRTALNREFEFNFVMAQGDNVELNEALNPGSLSEAPHSYRAPHSTNNTRIAGPYRYMGPIGCGQITPAEIWMRIVRPDLDSDVIGGVDFPKGSMQLPTGERFWFQYEEDAFLRYRRNLNVAQDYSGLDTVGDYHVIPAFASDRGWLKVWGVWIIFLNDILLDLPLVGELANIAGTNPALKAAAAVFDNMITGRSQFGPAPDNYEGSATVNHYTSYLYRPAVVEPGKVLVLTGKMPTFPRTANGEPTMEQAEVRYWGVANMARINSPDAMTGLMPVYGHVNDDEVATDAEDWYIIAYSQPGDRPSNAEGANGVTWVDWGPEGAQSLVFRWTSVMPEWHFPEAAPDFQNMPWSTSEWTSPFFDPDVVYRNDHGGVMGEYQPKVHYLTVEEFEALGSNPDPQSIPIGDDW